MVQVDPHTGKLAAEHFWGETFEALIYSFHATWLTWQLGDSESAMIAHNTITFLGLFLLISTVTGLYLWWPRAGTFLKAMGVQRQSRSPRIHFELHRLVGFYGSAVLLVLAFTGFNFGYGEYLKSAMAVVSPVEAEHFQAPEELKSTPVLGAKPIALEQAVATARQVFPEAELRRLVIPDDSEGVYAIEMRQPGEVNRRHPRSNVWIEQYTGEVLAVEDPNKFTAGETFFNLLWPLHTGEILELSSRILWCLIGFMPLMLYITGINPVAEKVPGTPAYSAGKEGNGAGLRLGFSPGAPGGPR
ncbi:PepSY-associated TM helix domain-containing protein [Nitrosococcus oceani]|uniref:PepSY-associated TM helix domain-containing protein n=1 Tax=Nitrosococcus oceani TaxID=1229 RepID=UPI0022B0143C|nr:PepSY-associated TM helix domain-containing protein [Nitrosococcus oceani]